jgi:dipicolinate synthase subunit A
VLLELASAPGGFDTEAAEKLGLKIIAAPGLPGQCAPYAAAELIRDAIYGVIGEREE